MLLMRLAAVALLALLAVACAEEPPPRAPPVAPPAPTTGASVWLVHLAPKDPQYKQAVSAIAADGDAATRRTATQRMIAWGREVTAPAWRETGREVLRRADAVSRLAPTPQQLEEQLDEYRDEELVRLLVDMERVGSPDAVPYAFEVAEDDAVRLKPRQAALAVATKLLDVHDANAQARVSAARARISAQAAADEAARAASGGLKNAPTVVRRMTPDLRRCYFQGLREDPDMKGSVRVTAKIGPAGEVLGVTTEGSGLSAKVVSCIVDRVSKASFDPPAGGGATLVIPLNFVIKDDPPSPSNAPAPPSP